MEISTLYHIEKEPVASTAAFHLAFHYAAFHYATYPDFQFKEHAAFNRFDQSEEEKRLFCISGDLKSNLRFRIYTFMLDHLTDSERLIILYRICMDILSKFLVICLLDH